MGTNLAGKTLLITGTSRGMGQALMKDLFLDG
jgi:NAD(P)-dependent dehydrogenase (short-subunit alcohol dehydrogenase family)